MADAFICAIGAAAGASADIATPPKATPPRANAATNTFLRMFMIVTPVCRNASRRSGRGITQLAHVREEISGRHQAIQHASAFRRQQAFEAAGQLAAQD